MANKVRNQLHRRKAKKEIEATNFPNLPDIDVKLVDKLSDIIRKLVEERGWSTQVPIQLAKVCDRNEIQRS